MAENESSSQQAIKSDDAGEDGSAGEVIGSSAIRPVFLGNLMPNYSADQVTAMFENPTDNLKLPSTYTRMPVDRIDVKRGYCFVFMKDAETQADKEQVEKFVKEINGIEVPGISRAVRSEFARGDGRVKRKEDERRKNIEPSETLFVVNFHEETTKKEDLEMLFSPFGELIRIDMKRNYAFVQFKNIEQATKAKNTTNGGKLDQSVLTVEYVARQRQNDGIGNNINNRRRRDTRDRGDDRRRYDGRRGERHRSHDDYRGRRDSPPPYRSGDHGRGRRDSPPPYRRGRSRSRSPPPRYGRSRSPRDRRYDDRYDDYRSDRYRRGPSPEYRRGSSPGRGPSPPRRGASLDRDRDFYRGDRDRGYRG